MNKYQTPFGQAFILIARNLARSGKFASYSWRQEMEEDAILTMVRYCRNFDPEKSRNPFAYLTKLGYNSFLHRIGVEKKNLELMQVLREDAEDLYGSDAENDDDYGFIESRAKQVNATFSHDLKYLKKKERKKKVRSGPTLDAFD